MAPQAGGLVLVHAAAGYGKTTALAVTEEPGWLWYNLDWSDRRPLSLAGRLCAAVGMEPIEADATTSGEAVAAALAHRLEDSPLTITFDRYETLGDGVEVGRFLTELLQLVPGLSLRVATRTRPDLALERLGLEGRLIEVGAATLRLSRRRIASTLAEAWNRPPSRAELEFADAVLCGWPAAIQLWLAGTRADEALTDPLRPELPLHNYLHEELLRGTLGAEAWNRLRSDPTWLIGTGPLADRATTDERRWLLNLLVRDKVGVVAGERGWELHPLVSRFIDLHLPAEDCHQRVVQASPSRPSVRIRTFGGLAVSVEGIPVDDAPWPAAARRLLELLLCQPGFRTRARQAAQVLWPGHLAHSAVNSFNVALHGLRRVLEPDLAVAAESRFVVREGNWYRLRVEDLTCDVDEFVQLLSQAVEPLDGGAAERLAAAVALCGEDFLVDSTEQFVLERRARLDRLRLEALERLADWFARLGHSEAALDSYNQLLEMAPHREDIWARVLEIHLGDGDRHGALASLHRCELSLHAVGAEPSRLLREVYGRVRRDQGTNR